jgi:hypothetical protein
VNGVGRLVNKYVSRLVVKYVGMCTNKKQVRSNNVIMSIRWLGQ